MEIALRLALCAVRVPDFIDTIVRKRYCKIHSTKANGQQRISVQGMPVSNPYITVIAIVGPLILRPAF